MSFADQNGMMSTDQDFHLSKEQACEYFVLILQILRKKIIIREPALSIKYEQSKILISSIKLMRPFFFQVKLVSNATLLEMLVLKLLSNFGIREKKENP